MASFNDSDDSGQTSRYYVALEGLPGAGKSAFIERMRSSAEVIFGNSLFMEEDMKNWKRLPSPAGPVDLFSRFLEEPKQYGFQFEIEMMTTIARRESRCPSNGRVPVIMKRSLESVRDVFGETLWSNGSISSSELGVLRRAVDFHREFIPMKPTGVIYIEVSPEEALRRIGVRSQATVYRRAESHITLDFLKLLDRVEKKYWLGNPDAIPVIRINGELPMEEMFGQLMTESRTLWRCLRNPEDIFG